MIKLMKYEFRKQALSKLIIVAFLAILEVAFFSGILLDKGNIVGTSASFLGLFTMGAMFFLAFESIITYSNDLKQKCSYMLFLTPNTSFSIVGAKVLSAGIQVFLAGVAFVAVYFIDGVVVLAKYDSIANLKELFIELLNSYLKLEIATSSILLGIAVLLISWIGTITLAFFSITLSTTFLADKKFKGILSLIIFFLIYYIYSKITSLALGNQFDILQQTNIYMVLNLLYGLCFIIITYIGTAWMLEKKVSL